MTVPVRQRIEGKRHKRSICLSDSTKNQVDDINRNLSKNFGTSVSLNVLLGIIIEQVWQDMKQGEKEESSIVGN